MPSVELQSELILSRFWKQVQREIRRLLDPVVFAQWKIVLRPKTPLDDGLVYGLSNCATQHFEEELARFILYDCQDPSKWRIILNASERTCEFVFPKGKQRWVEPLSEGQWITPELLACQLLDELEMWIEE